MTEEPRTGGAVVADFFAALTFTAGSTTAIVTLTAMLLAASAGLVGTFAVLRKRSLVSDALGHATLPGVVLAFIATGAMGLDPRHPASLMIGAAGTALLALWSLQWLRTRGRVDADAATSAVLAGSFGVGLVLLSAVQSLDLPQANGLAHVLFGQMATARVGDLLWLGFVGLVCLVLVVGARHALASIAFDEDHARNQGFAVERYDALLLVLLFAVTVSALPVVGAVLIVALVVLPASAARFWSDRLSVVATLAVLIGAGSAQIGAAISFAWADAPAGAVVVLVAGSVFFASLLLAPRRGSIALALRRWERRKQQRERALLAELSARADGLRTEAFDVHERRALRRLLERGSVVERSGRVAIAQEPR